MELFYYPRGTWNPINLSPDYIDKGDKPEAIEIFNCTYNCAVAVHPQAGDLSVMVKRYRNDRDKERDEGVRPDDVEEKSLFRHMQYRDNVRRFMLSLPLVLPVACDENLAQLWLETRLTVACGSWFGVCCCARGALECAVTDIGARMKLWPNPKESKSFFKDWPARRRLDAFTVSGEDLKRGLHDTYTFTSEVIHNGVPPSEEIAMETLERTRDAINELYHRFRTRLSPLHEIGESLSGGPADGSGSA